MKIYISILICLMAFAGVGFCQVDTMRLLEVGSVTAPGPITNWYFEDLNGDSIKEIILTTANSVNIYSGQSFAPIWSQDGFTNPQDLNFADINNDGLIDFSVKDTSHIYLIDPHHSTTIWTSPMLDSLYKCYTIGERNLDSLVDIVIIRAEVFNRVWIENNQDTIWIECYDSPQYELSADTFFLCLYYTYLDNYMVRISRSEAPQYSSIRSLMGNTQNGNYLLIYNSIGGSSSQSTVTTSSQSGTVYIFDVSRLALSYTGSLGRTIRYISFSDQNSNYVAALQKNSSYASGGGSVFYHKKYCAVKFSACGSYTDTIYKVSRGYQGGGPEPDWGGYALDCSNADNLKIGYSFDDSIYMKSFPGSLPIWGIGIPGDFPRIVCFYFNPVGIINSFLIYRKGSTSTYKCLNANTGELRFILANIPVQLQGSINLSPDSIDFLYSINSSSLSVFTVAPRVGINDPDIAPSIFFLSSNYPNPFNASTLIEYGLPESGPVKVEIFDILGRKVQTLVDETQSAGYHQAVWNGEDSPSGTYFYRIQTREKSLTRKCLLLK